MYVCVCVTVCVCCLVDYITFGANNKAIISCYCLLVTAMVAKKGRQLLPDSRNTEHS